eukprot:scaffold30751_cov25-Tisochrysis_lutea.AAC.4
MWHQGSDRIPRVSGREGTPASLQRATRHGCIQPHPGGTRVPCGKKCDAPNTSPLLSSSSVPARPMEEALPSYSISKRAPPMNVHARERLELILRGRLTFLYALFSR